MSFTNYCREYSMKLNTSFVQILSVTVPSITIPNIFTEEQCSQIIKIGKDVGLEDSVLVNGGVNKDIRKSKNCFIMPSEDTRWIFETLMGPLEWANDLYFNYDLYGFQNIQYAEYSSNGSYYDWHTDMEMGEERPMGGGVVPTRKLSASVILTDRSEYIGGEFFITRDSLGHPVNSIEQEIGSLILFPSYIEHKVSPVTEGTRSSLVAWVMGPKFK